MQGNDHHGGWYVCHTKPRQEAVAQARLQEQGYQVYLPELTRWVRHARGWQRSRSALFPRYAFVRPGQPGQSIAPVRSTPGVTTLVSFGHQLAQLSAQRLERLRELMIHAEAAGPQQPFSEGMNVFFSSGPLKGMSGIVSSVADERVTVLFTLLGRQQSVAVPLQHLAVA
jgi:transcriptional antiterminator RfaH